MIFHSVSLAVLFADQVAQAPVVIQCAQATPEPWWKSLLQVAQTIVPVAGGVWIAWMAFRWNSKKDHEQWVRENRKKEWRELLALAAEIEQYMPSFATGGELVSAVKGGALEGHLKAMTQAALKYVFIAAALDQHTLYRKLVDLRREKEQAHLDILTYEQSPQLAHQQGRQTAVDAARNFHSKFASIWNEVHALASKDLGL